MRNMINNRSSAANPNSAPAICPKLNFIASGGVSDIDGVKKLAKTGLHGAIIGKAYYEKAISLQEAIEVAK